MSEHPKRILVAVDYEPPSRKALQLALGLARGFGASIGVLHVWLAPYAERALHGQSTTPATQPAAATEKPSLFDRLQQTCQATMVEYLGGFDTSGVDLDWTIVSGNANEEIAEYAAKHGFDLVVVGTHGRSAVGRWLLGSVAEHTVRHCTVPVLVVPTR